MPEKRLSSHAGLVCGKFQPGLVQAVSEARQAALLVSQSLPVVRRNRCPRAGSAGLLVAVTLAFSKLMVSDGVR